MDINVVKEQRKKNVINNIEDKINKYIVGMGWQQFCMSCPDDLYEEIKIHFEGKGFKTKKESYYHNDMDGFETNDVGYNYYLTIE